MIKMYEWISVKDRLPTTSKRVLTYRKDNGVSIGFWGNLQWSDVYYNVLLSEVTHWMPFPEPPEEYKDEEAK